MAMFQKVTLNNCHSGTTPYDSCVTSNPSTFGDNTKLPVHNWFRYLAGFSAVWAYNTMRQYKEIKRAEETTVFLDPFAGVGTSVLCGEAAGMDSFGIEAHPFVAKIASTKLLWDTDIELFYSFTRKVVEQSYDLHHSTYDGPEFIEKCYTKDSLTKLENLRLALESLNNDTPQYKLAWLALVSILRETSFVGTSNIELIQPNKKKKKPKEPYEAFQYKVNTMISDMKLMKLFEKKPKGHIIHGDSRTYSGIKDKTVDLIITSPPYVNNFDYGDATRFEMTFMREVEGWKGLAPMVRKDMIISCAQQVTKENFNVESALKSLSKMEFYDEISNTYENLQKVRTTHGGKKNYHLMVLGYFSDMIRVWKNLRRVTKDNSLVKFVIGDSAPYGVYLPVEEWLGKMAIESGFSTYDFVKLRDRNVKWKNRKHRVPLKEGILTVSD